MKDNTDGGYLMIDNRVNEGVPEQAVRRFGLPLQAAKGMFEAKTITCSHCNAIVVMNPERTRERTFCKGCNHYICDGCASVLAQTGLCRTVDQILDEMQEATVLQQQRGSIILTA
jgi:hypothetical protein